jgi:hypothetical protein
LNVPARGIELARLGGARIRSKSEKVKKTKKSLLSLCSNGILCPAIDYCSISVGMENPQVNAVLFSGDLKPEVGNSPETALILAQINHQ